MVISLIGANQSRTGDVVSIVTVNKHTQVKVFDTHKPDIMTSGNVNYTRGQGGLMQYVIDFPNVVVNSGDEYNVSAFAAKTTNLVSKGDFNSPIVRPEIVDLSLR